MFGLSQLATQAIAAALAILLLIGGYFYWKRGVEQEALVEYNQKQIELVQEENAKTVKKLEKINQDQNKQIKELTEQNAALEKKLKPLKEYLQSPTVQQDYKNKPSSEVLKRTFRELNR